LEHAIERVGRPGGSHEGVGRKKKGAFQQKEHLLKCFQAVSWSLGFFCKVFQGSCFCLKARLPASSDDDNVFLNAALCDCSVAMKKQRLLSGLG